MKDVKTVLVSLSRLLRRIFVGSLAVSMALSILVCLVFAVYTDKVSALQLQNRSLTISSSALGNVTTDQLGNAAAPGSGGNGQKTEYTFSFQNATTGGNIGSILFEICTTPIAGTTCTSPTGFTAVNAGAILAGYAGINSGFATDSSTVLTGSPYNCSGTSPGRTNCIAIKNSTPQSFASVTTITVSFGGGASSYITNPTTAGTFFVRITTYSDSAYATQVDYGSAASSTATEVNINANVQETLGFSVGTTVTAPTSACTAFTDSGTLSLGDSNSNLSATTTYWNHSYYRIYTNDLHGSSVYYYGNTLHNAASTASISAIGTSVASSVGTSQFGIAIDKYDSESGSGYSFTSPDAAATGYNGGPTSTLTTQSGNTASLTGNYSFANSTTTATLISSSTAPISCDTGSVIYMANIATTTPTAVYGTTITYVAVPVY